MSDSPEDEELDRTIPLGDAEGSEAETRPISDKGQPAAALFDGRYRIVKLLGEGGFGKVYVVEDTLHANERLALKLVRPEHQDRGDFAQRFRNEIRVLRTMQHEGIPQIFNDGRTAEGEVYFTMALVPGRSLEEVLKERGVLPPLVVANYVRQIVSILDYAHGRGVVHRDLKPANVIVVDEGEGREKLKILDFGIAKILRKEGALEQALTMQTQLPIGTPHYMAPEQVRGREVDGRTDLYALGVMIHRMVSGKYPFAGGTAMEILAARLQADPTPLVMKSDTGGLSRLVKELLEREMDKRPSTVRIEELLVSSLEERRETNSLLRSLVAVGVAAVVIVALLLWAPWESEQEPEVERSTAQLGPGDSPGESSESNAADRALDSNDGASDAANGAGASASLPGESNSGEPQEQAATANSNAGGEDPQSGALDGASDEPAIEAESPTANAPVEPALPSLIRFEPAEGVRLPFDPILTVSGEADHALTRATVNGVDAELDGATFTAGLELASLVDAKGELRIQLWGERELPSPVIHRRVTLPSARVPAGCVAEPGSTFMQDGWASAVVHERSGIRLLLVGGAAGQPATAPAFYIGAHEVTWTEYERFRSLERPRSFEPDADHPVAGVSYADALEFCDRNGLELPTGEQWLFAAAGPEAKVYPWGDAWVSGACNSSSEASTDEFEFTSPAARVPSAEGASDVSWSQAVGFAGNVSEWCTDNGKFAQYGGSYLSDAADCQLRARQGFIGKGAATDVGFRVLLPLE